MFVSRQPKLFWLGLTVYLLSFIFAAVAGVGDFLGAKVGTQPLSGFFCAYFALLYPWVAARDALLHDDPPFFGFLAYVSLLISGLINPIFLAVVIFKLTDLHQRFASILKIAVVAMIPFSWIFIVYCRQTYPREGHFLWIIGILLVLFSDKRLQPTVS